MSYKVWKIEKIKNLGKVITGKTPLTKKKEYWDGETLFLTPSDDMDKKYISKTIRKVSEKALIVYKKNLIPENSISISCIGSDLGKVVILNKEAITNQQINSIIVDKKHDVNFIYYQLKIVGKKLNYLSKTSTAIPIINKNTFSEFEIFVSDLETEKIIARPLNSIDDKIENNNKINENLENLAQTLYKRWFVDFEFPNEKGEPYKSSGGEMVDSELGFIPKGWEVKKISQITSFNKRGIAPTYTKDNSGVPVINQRCIRGHSIVEEAVQYHDINLKKVQPEMFQNSWDVLINSMGVGTLGRVAVSSLKQNKIVHSCITILRPNLDIMSKSIFSSILLNLEPIFVSMGEGTTGQTSLNNKLLGNVLIVLPPMKYQIMISKTLEDIQITKDKNFLENKTLAALRDLLLPKLMSGEIEVPIEE